MAKMEKIETSLCNIPKTVMKTAIQVGRDRQTAIQVDRDDRDGQTAIQVGRDR